MYRFRNTDQRIEEIYFRTSELSSLQAMEEWMRGGIAL